jgi:hypothetical protein
MEVADVYEIAATGHAMWTVAAARNNFLSRVLIPSQHLLFIVGLDPRPAFDFDVRIYLDEGIHLDASLPSMHPHIYGAWEAMVDYAGTPSRALISQFAIREVVPHDEDSTDVKLLSVTDEFSSELWPELGHKR